LNFLLDTHVLLWWLADSAKIKEESRAAISDATNTVWVSAASAWEIAIKRALGKLEAPADLESAVRRSGFSALPITLRHAEAAGRLPRHHEDPFDRMLVAQASTEGLTIITQDTRFRRYRVNLLAD
jgi:PIN domain nuclease of toxin-antitoxin system